MIIVLKQDAPDAQVREFCHELEGMGLQINDSKGSDTHILGLIGDTKAIAESWVLANPVVETCRRVSEPYKKANRKFHPDDSVIDVDGVKIGGGNFAVIAGPCSIESEEQITYCAQRVKAAGASLLRGGAFKPRTSPYSFQGMRSEGLDLLKLARRATGSPIVTEIMNTEHLPLFENVDLIQVGARNMQNFELLKAVGRQKKPVLLKRGLANTLEEFVMSAEYIMAEGNENVILCERGIRTFETSMRNTLDLAGVVMLHKMTHLPVIVDPSHACGHAWMVPQLAKAAVAAGADGLMIEVHNDPAKAKCDGAQSLTPDQFDELMGFITQRSGVLWQEDELIFRISKRQTRRFGSSAGSAFYVILYDAVRFYWAVSFSSCAFFHARITSTLVTGAFGSKQLGYVSSSCSFTSPLSTAQCAAFCSFSLSLSISR